MNGGAILASTHPQHTKNRVCLKSLDIDETQQTRRIQLSPLFAGSSCFLPGSIALTSDALLVVKPFGHGLLGKQVRF